MNKAVRKYSARDVIARSYAPWDRDKADRLIAWLDQCGYTVVEKEEAHDDATLVPAEEHASGHRLHAH
jgi:hypothetical protein